MYRTCLCVYILSLFIGFWCSDEYRQEQAKVMHANPKYIADVVVFTGRKSRHEPYLTNMTATLLMAYGNNVTFSFTMRMTSGGDFRFEAGACESVKHKWMHQFMSSYTNLTLKKCPFPPARYSYFNMELPPRNIPVPMTNGDYALDYDLVITATKEPILSIRTLLHYDKSKINSKKNKKGKH